MNDSVSIPGWFKKVTGAAIAWNLIGLSAFVMDTVSGNNSLMPDWFPFAYGAATIGGTLGAVLLFMRKSAALPVLVISLVGVLAQFGHIFGATDALSTMGAAVLLPIAVIIISIGLVWLALKAKGKGWIS